MTSTTSCAVSFTPDSSLDTGFFTYAVIGMAPQGESGQPAVPHKFQVDTGSCGFAVGVQFLSDYYQQQARKQGPAALLVTYLPSHIEMWGWWMELPVALLGGDPSVADMDALPTAKVQVMVVDHSIHPSSDTAPQPFGGGMMGIGFNTLAQQVQERNPLLSVTVNGTQLPAIYEISAAGIVVGPDLAGYSFVDLAADDLPDEAGTFKGPSATLTISLGETTAGPLTCDLLMDTGVQSPMLFTELSAIPSSLYEASGGHQILVGNAEVSLSVPGTICSYSYAIGQKSPYKPKEFMVMNRAGSANSLNASIHLLGGFKYVLDFEKKRMGFASAS